MEKPQVQVIHIETPIEAVGKVFIGDYADSPKYASEVQSILAAAAVTFIPTKVLGVYYDNPENVLAENLKCFQGFIIENKKDFIPPALSTLSLKGKCIYTKVSGDPAKIIFDGYNAIFRHIQENGIALKSSASYQVSTFENNVITIEIFMEVL